MTPTLSLKTCQAIQSLGAEVESDFYWTDKKLIPFFEMKSESEYHFIRICEIFSETGFLEGEAEEYILELLK